MTKTVVSNVIRLLILGNVIWLLFRLLLDLFKFIPLNKPYEKQRERKYIPFFDINIKCIKHYITPGFPKLGLKEHYTFFGNGLILHLPKS